MILGISSGPAAKDIENSEKIIKDQQAILVKRKAKMLELDVQLAEAQADVAKFEILDSPGAADKLGIRRAGERT